jgi:hypothetical protein
VQVAVADAAVGDGNLHILRAQLAGFVVVRQKFSACCVSCKTVNLGHVSESSLARGKGLAESAEADLNTKVGTGTDTEE